MQNMKEYFELRGIADRYKSLQGLKGNLQKNEPEKYLQMRKAAVRTLLKTGKRSWLLDMEE